MNNFDRIAPIYDRLVQIVFGKAMRRAQAKFLKEIGAHSNVLILGGGTGWLLAELLRIRPDCKVIYIDASKRMIEMAQKNNAGACQNVSFIHGTEKQIPNESTFEAVITHFYLDLFDERSCRATCKIIRNHCHAGSLWIACDFVDRAWWHGTLLKIMYSFFGLTTNLLTKRLPDWRAYIQQTGFSEIVAGDYFSNFICSAYYKLDSGLPKGSSGQISAPDG